MTGPAPIFEGELGIMKLLTGPFELGPLGGNGRPYMITQTYIKFWPAEYHSQSAIDAALQLRPEVGDVRNVAAIDIATFDAAVDIIGKDPEKWRPRTRETADHSLALLHGRRPGRRRRHPRSVRSATLHAIPLCWTWWPRSRFTAMLP